MIDWYFCVLLNSRRSPTGSMFFCDVDYKKVYALFFKVLWRYMVREYFHQQHGYWSIAIYCSSSHPSYITRLTLKLIPNFMVSRVDWWSTTVNNSIFKIDSSNAQRMSRVDILKEGCEKVRDVFVKVYNSYRECRFAIGTCMFFCTKYESRDKYMKRCAADNDMIYEIDTGTLTTRPCTTVGTVEEPLIKSRYHLDAMTAQKTGWWYAIVYYELHRHCFGYNTCKIDENFYAHIQNKTGVLSYSQDFDEVLDHYMSMKFKVGPTKWDSCCIVKTLVNPLSWDPCMFLGFPYLNIYMNVNGLREKFRYVEEFPTTYKNHPAYKAMSRYTPSKIGEVLEYNPKTDEILLV